MKTSQIKYQQTVSSSTTWKKSYTSAIYFLKQELFNKTYVNTNNYASTV